MPYLSVSHSAHEPKLVIYDIVSIVTNYELSIMKYEKKNFALALGNRVRAVRKYKGYTLETLSIESGMEVKHLTRIEYGEINTSVFQIYKLCYTLEVELAELFSPIALNINEEK